MSNFKPLKDVVVTELSSSKSFNYQKGGVGLNFALKVDSKTDLNDFLAILEKAISDVKEELKKIDDGQR